MEKVTKLINIAILDARNAGSKDLGEVNMINVGYILHTPETFNQLKGGKRINVGRFVEANLDARVLVSPTNLSDAYLSQQENALELLAFGPVIVDWETTPEAIEYGIERLDIYGGPLICPRHLLSALQPKIINQDGDTILYEGADARVVMGKLVLDMSYLDSMKDDTELIVVGSLKLPKVVQDNVLKQKVKQLVVEGKVTCHEENAGTIRSILSTRKNKIKIIPAGYELIEKALVLTNLALESMGAKKIYCTEWVEVDTAVSAEIMDQNLEALISDEYIYCPAGLKEIIVQKCDWLKTNVVMYTGDLWVIEDARELPNYAFDHVEGVATLVVFGELKLDPQISPETLIDNLDKVHNFGSISCTPEQMGAIQSLLGLSEGRLQDSTKPPKKNEAESDGDVITESYINANYVSL